MRRLLLGLFLGMLVVVAFAMGFLWAETRGAAREDRVVAVRWGDGKYGPGFYGAEVFLEPAGGAWSVRGRVRIGAENGMSDELGEIGRVKDHAEAVARFGGIEFRDDGVHLGEHLVPRARLEAHR